MTAVAFVSPAGLAALLQATADAEFDIDEITQEEGAAAWVVAYRQGWRVLVEWSAEPQALVLSASLGSVPAGRRLPVYTTLLGFNLAAGENDGWRVGLGGPEAEVFLQRTVRADAMPGSLAELLAQFVGELDGWAGYVVREDDDDGDGADAGIGPDPLAGFQRV